MRIGQEPWPFLVRELETWHAQGYIRFHGTQQTDQMGTVYLIENASGGMRRLTELMAHEFCMGLFAGQRPRFAVADHSTVPTSAGGAA